MKECEYKKRLQLYLDGWVTGTALAEIEEHLKSCPDCQAEMTELLEVNGAAFEIIDQAPDRYYWESFTSRVRNRIIARDSETIPFEKKSPRYPTFSLASVLIIIVLFIGATVAFLFRPAEKIEIVMPPTIVQHNSPGLFPHSALFPPPRLAGFGLENYTPRPPVNAANPEPGKAVDNGNEIGGPKIEYPQLEIRNLVSQFKTTSPLERTEFPPTNDYALTIPPSFVDNANGSYPAFRLKDAFVGQRLLASMGTDAPNSANLVYQDQLLGYNPTSATVDGTSSNWGYLRDPSDTSKSGEIKKYYIELELMQTK